MTTDLFGELPQKPARPAARKTGTSPMKHAIAQSIAARTGFHISKLPDGMFRITGTHRGHAFKLMVRPSGHRSIFWLRGGDEYVTRNLKESFDLLDVCLAVRKWLREDVAP